MLLVPILAQAQALDPTFAPPNSLYTLGPVYALGPQQADGKRLLAGSFTRVNNTAYNGTLLRLNATGTTDAAFAQNVGAATNVNRIKIFANGQYLLGSLGGSITAGGLARVEVMRLNTDGTGDATFDPGTGPAMTNDSGFGYDYTAQPDGKVLVAGYFDSFNGVAANGLVRLTATGSVDTGFNTAAGIGGLAPKGLYAGAVAMQVDGKILVAGTFSTFNGATAYGLARLNANGSIDATFTTPFIAGSEASTIVVQPDGKILVSGLLNTSNLSAGLVRLTTNGSLDTGFSAPFVAGFVGAGFDPPLILQADGKLIVVGGFTTASVNQIVRLNTNGSLDTSFSFTTGFEGTPYTVGVQADGTVLVGGFFNNFGNTERSLVRLTTTGSLDLSFVPKLQTSGSISAAVRQPDGQLVIGGTFTEYNGVAVHRVVRVSATGVVDASFAAATGILPGNVNCLALQPDGKVLVGTGAGLVRLAANGAPDASFAAFTHPSITAVAVQPDGRILMGGPFSSTNNGVSYSNLARLTTSGALDPTFTRQVVSSLGTATSTTALLVQSDGRIVVAGRFTPTGQAAVARVVRYESTGAFDASFANTVAFTIANSPNSPAGIYALAQQPDGKLLAGGNFTAVGGSPHYGVARLTTTGTVDATFSPSSPLPGVVYTLALQANGRVLVGGSFSITSTASTLVNLARVLPDGTTDTSFQPTTIPNGQVRSLIVQPDGAIVLAGYFTAIGGQPSLGLARINAPNVLAVTAPIAIAARTMAWPVPAHGLLHVAPDPSAQPFSAELLDALGRTVRQQPLTNAAEFTILVEGLPAGVYLLRVQYTEETVTRRLAIE